jgi:hypothetical protein
MVEWTSNPAEGRQWLLGVATWVFDLDQGQKLTAIHPEGALSHEETQDVACLSFPVRRSALPPLLHAGERVAQVSVAH